MTRQTHMLLATLLTLLFSQFAGAVTERRTDYSYDPVTAQVSRIDGPRTDVNDITLLDYAPGTGNLIKITNALGHSTELTEHDASGRPQRIIDPNGHITELRYHPRGWLTHRSAAGLETTFVYDPAGQLVRITRPNGAEIHYRYDAAQRLIEIRDNLGNRIHYTRDAMGNRLREAVSDERGLLTRSLEGEYDQLSRLQLLIGGAGQLTRYQYDANGNRIARTDPRQTGTDRVAALTLDPQQTDNTHISLYDALNRLISTVHMRSHSTDSDDISSDYRYNALDQLLSVTDPNGLETRYQYTIQGDLLAQHSPDTGITTYTYDEVGNRLSQTDARGVTTHYSYDALNRLTTVSYPDSSLNVTYTYDENDNGQHGIGRLTTMTDAGGITRYRYDSRGNLTAATITRGIVTLTTSYAWNSVDQLRQMTYPGGRIVDYAYDTAGRISEVTTTDAQGAVQTLLSDIDYQPFGPMNSWAYGNGLTAAYGYDLGYRQTSLSTPGILERNYDFDQAGNITGIDTPDPNRSQGFGYDGLNRLDDAQGVYGSLSYQYDPTGNRTQRTDDGTVDIYNYLTDNHHLQDINGSGFYAYDANGNTTGLPNPAIYTGLVYGDHNRLTQVNGVTYTYNGRGERVIKDNGSLRYYSYDLNGLLIAESDASGQPLKEYLYVNGQLIALTQSATQSGSAVEVLLDNTDAVFSDAWTLSTSIAGYQGADYQYHAGGTTGPGILGNPVDNLQATFTGSWPHSTSVQQYYADNYQYHAGGTAGPGILGDPIDNLQAVYMGNWPTSTSVKQYYADNYQHHAAGTGANTATWPLNVSIPGDYDVYVNWTARTNRASNAKYTIQHTTGSDNVSVNQQQNGGQWNLLGTYALDGNSRITLSDDANGYVIADGISLLPAGTPPALTPQGDTATWALNVSAPGSYDVYAGWTERANRATDAKYTLQHSNGSDTVTVNQQQNGGQWNLLGTYTLDQNSRVDLSSDANGYVIADGITVLPAGAPATVIPQEETATWPLNQTGEFKIYANWTERANRATDAKYTIRHSSGSDTVTVNQQQNGGQWNLLGIYTLDHASQISLSSNADGYVIADGIRLVSTGPGGGAPSGVYYVHNDHLGTPQVITDDNQTIVWQANYDPFGKASISTETVTNNVRFPGQYFDAETGLHYNYYRYYDPETGRYITSDRIGLRGGINTYGYVSGNPINFVDPSGQFACGGLCIATATLVMTIADVVIPPSLPPEHVQDAIVPSLGPLDLLGGIAAGARVAKSVCSVAAKSAEKGGLNLFKWGDKTSTKVDGWKEGDRFLHLPNKGSPKANWEQNSGRLREEMGKGKPIYDSYRNSSGQQIRDNYNSFINAERQLLESRGWRYNSSSSAYHPPN